MLVLNPWRARIRHIHFHKYLKYIFMLNTKQRFFCVLKKKKKVHEFFREKIKNLFSGRGFEPTCVDIPSNMALCSNIEYTRMRLPNLLAHDTLEEVAHQSAQWVPLMTVSTTSLPTTRSRRLRIRAPNGCPLCRWLPIVINNKPPCFCCYYKQ